MEPEDVMMKDDAHRKEIYTQKRDEIKIEPISFTVLDQFCFNCHKEVFTGHCVCTGYTITCCEEGYKFVCDECSKYSSLSYMNRLKAKVDILRDIIEDTLKR